MEHELSWQSLHMMKEIKKKKKSMTYRLQIQSYRQTKITKNIKIFWHEHFATQKNEY